MTDNFNSQPLIPGVAFFQTTFGLGSDDGDELVVPPVFIPEEPALEDAGDGRAFAVQSPKIGSIDIVEAIPAVPVPKSTASTILRPRPKIGSITIIKKK